MKVEGSFVFPAEREKVWDALLNPEALQACIPGCQSLDATGEDQWNAVLKVGVASIKGTYKSKVAIVDKQAPERYTLNVEGSGGPGFVKGSAQVLLAEAGPGQTTVTVLGEGNVGGTVAGVGQRMLGGVAKMLMTQFFDCLKARLT